MQAVIVRTSGLKINKRVSVELSFTINCKSLSCPMLTSSISTPKNPVLSAEHVHLDQFHCTRFAFRSAKIFRNCARGIEYSWSSSRYLAYRTVQISILQATFDQAVSTNCTGTLIFLSFRWPRSHEADTPISRQTCSSWKSFPLSQILNHQSLPLALLNFKSHSKVQVTNFWHSSVKMQCFAKIVTNQLTVYSDLF